MVPMTKSWVQLIVGVWILASPWVFGFSDVSIGTWSNVICGVILIVIGAHSILLGGNGMPEKTERSQK